MTDTAIGFTSSRHNAVIAKDRNRLTTVEAYLVMVVSPGKKKGLEEISEKARIAAAAVSDLISSMTLAVEKKVALEHQIHNLARESEYMINGIDNISKTSQRKVLLAYRKFLQENLDAVDERLKQLKNDGND